jgi:6-phosphogluconate dehydrogenase
MVHSAIEHSDMHLIADMYNIFSNIIRLASGCVGCLCPLEPGRLHSDLIAITAKVLARKDGAVALVDLIFDRTG